MDIGDVRVDTFEGREGETFSIEFADGKLDLTLVAVERLPDEWGRAERQDAFSLIFEDPGGRLLPQQVWPLDHEELGRLEVFLVPLEPEGAATRLQAVFT
jgi:hypothetical protein